MNENKSNSNSDLLKCENKYFTKENENKSLLITKSAQKRALIQPKTSCPLMTEKISSQVLDQAKLFLDKTKNDETIGQKCDLIDESCDDVEDDRQMIEMNLLLFENKSTSDDESSEDTDEESESSEDSETDSDDSDDEKQNNKRIKLL